MSSLMLAAVACAPPSEAGDPTRGNNHPPVAMLKAPVIAQLGHGALLDASASHDPEGEPLTYIFQFSDGSNAVHTSDPICEHTFGREAIYTVLLRVVDLVGHESMAEQDVTVRAEFPNPPDFCAEHRDCVVGDECDNGVCYANGGTIE